MVERDHWRHRHAKAYAHSWRSTKREIVTAFLGGAAALGSTVPVTNLNPGFYVLIALGGGLIGLLPWVSVYVFAAVTAGPRLVRERLTKIEQAIESIPGRVQVVRPLSSPAPSKPKATQTAKQLNAELGIADMLLQRLPHRSLSILGGVAVTAALAQEVGDWISRVGQLLRKWPQYQAQFTGPIPIGKIDLADPPAITQEVSRRRDLLRKICDEVAKSE